MIPFEIRTLKKRHTEKWRARRIVYYKAICWHRGTIGAWRNRGYLRVLLILLILWSTSLQSSGFARFLKTFITKVISNTYTTALSLFVPSAPPWYCLLCFHLRVLPLSVWLLYVVGLLYHSKFLKNHLRCIVGKCQEHTSSVAFINSCFYFFLDLLW